MPLTAALVLATAFAGSDCIGAPVTATELESGLGAAETSIRAMDMETLQLDMAEVHLMIPCLSDPVATDQAARVHLYTAIEANETRPGDPVIRPSLARFRALGGSVPPDLLAHPLPDTPSGGGTFQRVPAPVDGHLAFDGIPTRDRPAAHPSLFQHLDVAGRVRTSAYLLPGEPLPPYARRRPAHQALWISAATTAGLAAGTVTGALLADAGEGAGPWIGVSVGLGGAAVALGAAAAMAP